MNKGAIRTHFKALLNRSDCTNALADTFVDQGISRIQRVLRIPSMEAIQPYAITSHIFGRDLEDASQTSSIALPATALEVIDIYHNNSALTRVPLHEMLSMKATGQAGTALHFTQQGTTILLFPEPSSGTVNVSYYGPFATMTADSDENALAATSSDLIIYAALSYAGDYFLDERGPIFEEKYLQFLAEEQEQANEAAQAGSIQVMRPSAIYAD